MMNAEKLLSAKKLFFILLGVDITVTAAVGVNAFSTISVLKAVQSGSREFDQSLLVSFQFWEGFSKLIVLTMIAVGLGLVKWLNTCYRFATDALGATEFKNQGWTAAGWIIPILSLFKPYQIINEIYKVGSPTYTAPDAWKKESGSSLLLMWWLFWVVIHLIGFILSRQLINVAMRDDVTLQEAIGASELQAWSCVVSILIAYLWFLVANTLTGRLLDRSSTLTANSNPGLVQQSILPAAQTGTMARDGGNDSITPSYQPRTATHSQLRDAFSDTGDSVAQLGQAADTAISRSNLLPDCEPKNTITDQPMDRINEDTIYQQIAEELESNAPDKGIWTRAFAVANGDDRQTRVLYINLRAEKLIAEEKTRIKALRDLEEQQRQDELRRMAEAAAKSKAEEDERIRCLSIIEKIRRGMVDAHTALFTVGQTDCHNFLYLCRHANIQKLEEWVGRQPMLLAVADSDGNTALHITVRERGNDLIRFFVNAGANLDAKNHRGETPLDLALTKSVVDIFAEAKAASQVQTDIVSTILARGQ